jgi:hypothetical protein
MKLTAMMTNYDTEEDLELGRSPIVTNGTHSQIDSTFSYGILLYILVPLIICGWISDFWDAWNELEALHIYLVTQGPPIECQANYLHSYLFSESHAQKCQDYYIQLQTTNKTLPNIWHVTLKCFTQTLIQPIRSLLDMISQLPYFLQYSLMCCMILSVCIWIATRSFGYMNYIQPLRVPKKTYDNHIDRVKLLE